MSENFKMLQMLKKHWKVWIGLMSLLVAVGQGLAFLAVFKCPCSGGNVVFGMLFLMAPALVLLLLGFWAVPMAWKKAALVAPILWITLSLLSGTFYVCLMTGIPWGFYADYVCQETSYPSWCSQELHRFPCLVGSEETPDSEHVLLTLKAHSQALGGTFLMSAVLLILLWRKCAAKLGRGPVRVWPRRTLLQEFEEEPFKEYKNFKMLQMLKKHWKVWIGLMSLLVAVGQGLDFLAVFKCPCSGGNVVFGMLFLMAPALVLLLLGFWAVPMAWKKAALVAPILWITLSLLSGTFYVCLMTGIPWGFYADYVCQETSYPSWCSQELHRFPCLVGSEETPDSEHVLLTLKAHSQALGGTFLSAVLLILLWRKCAAKLGRGPVRVWPRRTPLPEFEEEPFKEYKNFKMLQMLKKHWKVWIGLMSLLVAVGQGLAFLAVFKCPCSGGNVVFGMLFLMAPALVLLLLGFWAVPMAWKKAALVAPILWITLSLLSGTFYVCLMTGIPWGFYADYVCQETSYPSWCSQELHRFPCLVGSEETPDSEHVLLTLKAHSQALGGTFLMSAVLLILLWRKCAAKLGRGPVRVWPRRTPLPEFEEEPFKEYKNFKMLQMLKKHWKVWIGLMSLLVAVGQGLAFLAVFKCPCSGGNVVFGMLFLMAPALVLLLLGFWAVPMAWKKAALVAPILWITLSLLSGTFYVCLMTGIPWGFYADYVCQETSYPSWCSQELHRFPCLVGSEETPDSEHVLLTLKAHSQALGGTFLSAVLLILLWRKWAAKLGRGPVRVWPRRTPLPEFEEEPFEEYMGKVENKSLMKRKAGQAKQLF